MRGLTQLLALSPSLVLWCLAILSTQADASTFPLTSPPEIPLQYARNVQNVNSKSWFNRARDCVIQNIWRLPSDRGSHAVNRKVAQRPNPPPKLLARYGGDIVLRFNINSIEEAQALAEAVNVLFLDVWEFTAEWADIRLSKDVLPSLLGLLPSSLQHAHTPLMHDLAQAIFESYPSLTFVDPAPQTQQPSRPFSADLRPSTDETNIFFREYQPLSVILPWMRLLRSLFPTHVRMITVGISYEGRDIPALRVGVHPTNSEKPWTPRKTIVITGGSHAREWISTSSVNYVAYTMITGYGRSKPITKMLEKFDFVFVPTLNPDGYIHTWEHDRLWRKNRQQTSLRFCTGLDLDRSYGFEWSTSPNSQNPCSESFAGDHPFEAMEAQHFANWVKNETENNNVKIAGFLDFHSYSQQVLYPYSYSCISSPPSLENLEELAIGLVKAIRITNGERYGVTSACEGSVNIPHSEFPTPSKKKKGNAAIPLIETTGGSALDYFYHELKATYAYQLKLRDTGSYGFLLPASEIVPTGKEAAAAVQYFGEYLMGNKGIESESEEGGVHEGVKMEKFDGEDGGGDERVREEGERGEEGGLGEEWVVVDKGEGEQVGDAEWELKRRRR